VRQDPEYQEEPQREEDLAAQLGNAQRVTDRF